MRHRPPLVLNVPYTAGSGPKKLSVYCMATAVGLEILCISDISGPELLQCYKPKLLPTTRKECITGFNYAEWNELELEKLWMYFK